MLRKQVLQSCLKFSWVLRDNRSFLWSLAVIFFSQSSFMTKNFIKTRLWPKETWRIYWLLFCVKLTLLFALARCYLISLYFYLIKYILLLLKQHLEMHYRFSRGVSSAADCNWSANDLYFQNQGFSEKWGKKGKSSAEYQWDLDCPLAYLCPYEETDQLSLNLIVVLSARFFPMGNVNTPICFVWPETNMVQSLTLYAFFFLVFECFMFIRTHRALTWNKPKVSSKFSFTRRSLKFIFVFCGLERLEDNPKQCTWVSRLFLFL